MATFLFVVQPAMGHLNPMLAIARALQARGHSVIFATTAFKKIKSAIINDGFSFESVRPSLNILALLFLPFLSGFWETFVAIRCFFSSIPYYARAIGRIVDRLRPKSGDTILI